MAIYLVGYSWWQGLALPGGVPFSPALILVVVAAIVAMKVRGRRVGPLFMLVVGVCAASILTDSFYLVHIRFTDLGIYLEAGRHLLRGEPVYALRPLASLPRDATQLPFLYPPATVPLFGLLAALPFRLGGILFVAGSVALVVVAARRLGLSPPCSWLVIAWPPVFDGLMSGNVSVPLLALFVLAPWFGAGLVLAPLFKPYSVVAALWLVRERRFRAIVSGAIIAAVLCLLTLPISGGISAWFDWIAGLGAFAQSVATIPALAGVGLGRYLPLSLIAVIAAVIIAAALLARGPGGLGRLGVATLVLQPSVYPHGFIVALPALLTLRTGWFWAAMAPLSLTPSVGSWIAVVIVVASWGLPALRRESPGRDDPWHPLGPAPGPWAEVPERARF